jgi:hypothetical protein
MEDAATDTKSFKSTRYAGFIPLSWDVDDLEIALDIKLRMFRKRPHKKKQYMNLTLVSHDRDFLQGMSNLVYEFRDQR